MQRLAFIDADIRRNMKYDYERDTKKRKYKRMLRQTVIFALEIFAVILLAYLLIYFSLEKTQMLGSSMETTLKDEDTIIINKFSYWKRNPKRFDVVVFKQSGKEHSYYNIKRVIGLPGETIQIKEGRVFINEQALEEPMNVDIIHIPGLAEEPIVLEENEFFVLGDSRNNSEDSRFTNIGNIVKDDIIGKAWIKVSPFDIISKMNQKDETNEQKKEE